MDRKSIFAALAALALAAYTRAETYVYDLARDGGSIATPTSVSIGDIFDISLPDAAAFSLEVVSAPPAGITGQSFIAKDALSDAVAVLKPLANGIRITIDDFANARNVNLRVKDGHASFTMCDTSSAPADSCATCGEGLPLPEPTPTTDAPAPKASTAKLRLADADAERINIPANPRHYWRYRMHMTIEQLMKASEFNAHVKELISQSGR